ncbi:MAG: hypothetical protein HC904_11830, partial [Blastochloris sp.]|nr:hypothetical protein [Blastochloris sp.]
MGRIDAGTLGDVSLDASGRILDLAGSFGAGRFITADELSVIADGNPGVGNNAVQLFTDVNRIKSLKTTAIGNVVIRENGAVELASIDLSNGDFVLWAEDDVVLGRVDVTPARNVTLNSANGNITMLNVNRNQSIVIADKLFASSATGLNLFTTVAELNLLVTASGDVVVSETDSVLAASLVGPGNISLTGGLYAVNGIDILTGSNLSIQTITAQGNVVLNAIDGRIRQAVDAATGQALGRVRGQNLNATAFNAIDLLTGVSSLNARSSLLGSITITEEDALILNDVEAARGPITVTSGSDLTATRVVALDDGVNSQINLRTLSGNLAVGILDSSLLSDVILESAGNISDLTGKIFARELRASAFGSAVLDTTVESLVASTQNGNLSILESDDLLVKRAVTSIGNIRIESASGSLELDEVTGDNVTVLAALGGVSSVVGGKVTSAGLEVTSLLDMNLVTKVATAQLLSTTGDIFLREDDALTLIDVRSGGDEIDISAVGELTVTYAGMLSDSAQNVIRLSSTAGNLFLDAAPLQERVVDAGTLGSVYLTAQGAIQTVDGRVRASYLEARASSGISLWTEVTTLNVVNSGVGAVSIAQLGNLNVAVDDLFVEDGSLTVTTTGDLNFADYTANTLSEANDLVLTAGGDLTINNIDLGPDGDASLEATAGSITLVGLALIQVDRLSVRSLESQNLRTKVKSLAARVTGTGSFSLEQEGDLIVEELFTTDGFIDVEIDGGDLAITGGMQAGSNGNVDLRLLDGAISQSSGTVQGNVLTVTATGSVQLLTQVASADVFSSAGSLSLNETDGITLTRLETNSAPITVQAGGTLTAVLVDSNGSTDAGDITLGTSLGDLLYGTIDAGVQGDILLTAEGNILPIASILRGDQLTATAGGNLNLITEVNGLSATSTGGGNITISELNNLTARAVSLGGTINVTLGGNLLVNGILTNTGTVTLTVATGTVSQVAGTLVTASLLTVDSQGSISLLTDVDEAVLETLLGNITLEEQGDILLQDLSAALGNITVTARNAITVDLVSALGTVNLTAGLGITQADLDAAQEAADLADLLQQVADQEWAHPLLQALRAAQAEYDAALLELNVSSNALSYAQAELGRAEARLVLAEKLNSLIQELIVAAGNASSGAVAELALLVSRAESMEAQTLAARNSLQSALNAIGSTSTTGT